jgi:hypothetical protein
MDAVTYRLVAFYDLREWDRDLGAYIPLAPGCGNVCARCAREHARVFELEEEGRDGTLAVGSTCARGLLEGAMDRELVKTAEAAARRAFREKKRAAVEEAMDRAVFELTGATLHALEGVVPWVTADTLTFRDLSTVPVLVARLGAFKGEAWGTQGDTRPLDRPERRATAIGAAVRAAVEATLNLDALPRAVRERRTELVTRAARALEATPQGAAIFRGCDA